MFADTLISTWKSCYQQQNSSLNVILSTENWWGITNEELFINGKFMNVWGWYVLRILFKMLIYMQKWCLLLDNTHKNIHEWPMDCPCIHVYTCECVYVLVSCKTENKEKRKRERESMLRISFRSCVTLLPLW